MTSLFEKIYAIEAAAAIANSMGDISEGLSYQEIDARYGFLHELLPQDKKEHVRKQPIGYDLKYYAHHRPSGMTEDGMERHRLLTTAVIEKKGRITVNDLAKVWARDIRTDKFGYLLGPQDQVIYYSILAGIPPADIGRYAAWPGFIGTSKMIAPIGIINACNPEQAALDAYDVGRLKDARHQTGNYALEVAAAFAAAVAEGLKPGATLPVVLDVALGQLSAVPRKEVDMGLAWAKDAHDDWKKLRPPYAEYYEGRPISNAVEIFSQAVAVLTVTGPDPKEVILRCVNFGRDTDCKAYVASCIAAAIAGPSSLPQDWIRTVDDELKTDPYTVSKRSLHESADGLYQALLNSVASMKSQVAQIETQI
jgi:ADP-ribosylglycohydrolase